MICLSLGSVSSQWARIFPRQFLPWVMKELSKKVLMFFLEKSVPLSRGYTVLVVSFCNPVARTTTTDSYECVVQPDCVRRRPFFVPDCLLHS